MLDKYYIQAIEDAITSLKDDGVIIVPTDTIYGLACLASSKVAIERIYQIKNRDKEKLLPIIVDSFAMLKKVVDVDMNLISKLSSFFPGSITIVCKRRATFDYFDVPTIAVRMIETPLINKIISTLGEPLALTSANLSNCENISDSMELLNVFDGMVDCVFLDNKMKKQESTIIEILDNGELKLIRQGKIPFDKILKEYNNA